MTTVLSQTLQKAVGQPFKQPAFNTALSYKCLTNPLLSLTVNSKLTAYLCTSQTYKIGTETAYKLKYLKYMFYTIILTNK